ncbi:50S ribosomal protein L3 [Candidatus Woesearchaeota archaeon]|nr:50S ribosomal protein L3 [Candidatus Woesearchaeota archaeon]
MQFWPRKRAKRPVAVIGAWARCDKPQLLGFAGYKVGMTNITIVDNSKHTLTKGERINVPVSVIECPPLKIASVRFYKQDKEGLRVVKEIMGKADKELARKISLPKDASNAEKQISDVKPEDFDEVRVNVFTQPKLTGIGKKKPEFFEMAVGGSKEDALSYAKENLTKDIFVKDVFPEGSLVDFHVVTKGYGFQGPVKRFGIGLRNHKSEKVKRGPGSLGGWKGQAHFMYKVAHAGQTGYHTRTEYNKKIISIYDEVEKINPKGGFPGYGVVKNQYILVKGSVGGARKRLVRFNIPFRKNKKITEEAPNVVYISTESKQGR